MSYASEVLADSPKGYWRLGEGSGTSAADASGQGNTGTYKNTPTLGVAGALLNDSNPAITLNGTTQYISVANSASLALGDVFTYEAWIKRGESNRGFFDTILHKEGTPNTPKFGVTGPANRLQLRVPSVKTICESTTEVLADGLWHHVVATKNGATVKLYIDGVDRTGTVTNETCQSNTAALTIGAENTVEEFFKGSIDEVAVYATALSEARIKAHYQAALLPRPGSRSLMGVGR